MAEGLPHSAVEDHAVERHAWVIGASVRVFLDERDGLRERLGGETSVRHVDELSRRVAE